MSAVCYHGNNKVTTSAVKKIDTELKKSSIFFLVVEKVFSLMTISINCLNILINTLFFICKKCAANKSEAPEGGSFHSLERREDVVI